MTQSFATLDLLQKHFILSKSIPILPRLIKSFDLEGRVVGEAVTAINTIVQTSRWEHHPKLSSNVAVLNQLRISILKQLFHLFFDRTLPRDCHVSRQPRLPRNDRLIAALHQTRRSAIATKEDYKCRLYTYLAVGGEVLPHSDI